MLPEDYQNLENENNNPPNPPYQGGEQHPAPLGKGQKAAVAALAVFAVFAVILWSRQFKNSISGPFNNGQPTQNLASLSNKNSDEDLKNKDTDLDGLSDWDELNLYLTSPYLEDSDSDGFSDKEEIDAGKDPNCPAGRDCYTSTPLITDEAEAQSNNSNNSSLNSILGQLGSGAPAAEGTANAGGEVDLEALLGGEPDAATLRQLLIAGGMDENILNQISDEDLLKSYQEVSNQ